MPSRTSRPDAAATARFNQLQERLLPVWHIVEGHVAEAHTSVVVPSLSFDQEEMDKIQGVSFYEERLLFSLIRLRDPRATVIYLTSEPIHPEIVEYYLSLLRGVSSRSARNRLHLLCLYDSGSEPLTAKILERPRLLERIRSLIPNPMRAYLTCFNSSELERRLAIELGIPLNGADPDLLWLGTKSGSRKVFEEAGVDQAMGFADLHARQDVLDALAELAARRPGLKRAVLKLNESFAGAGNALFTYPPSSSTDAPSRAALDQALHELAWTSGTETLDAYLRKMSRMGGVVEEFVEAEELRSPSAQLRVNPNGEVVLISTHDQVLGGPTGQTYLGCRFPGAEEYRELIQEQGQRVGAVLRDHGVVSRFGVDFLVFPRADGRWSCLAVEINLRMGGTTAPFMALQFLTGGRFEEAAGTFRAPSGTEKCYYATDNLRSPRYRGLLPEDFMDILAANHLHWDPSTETGTVFHMIGALSQFGKVGVTCIADTQPRADALYQRVVEVLDREAGRVGTPESRNLHPFEVAAPGME